MNLFVIYIGGAHQKSLIELHDIRFVLAENIKKTYNELRRTWWGISESLHIDAYGILKWADGYRIHLKDTPDNNDKKLYFLNLGGYSKNEFTELHQNIFIVAENETQAKIKAKSQISQWEFPHKDYQYDIENILDLTPIGEQKNKYLHLELTNTPEAFEFTCQYIPIGVSKEKL
jgi:hypothetical protein